MPSPPLSGRNRQRQTVVQTVGYVPCARSEQLAFGYAATHWSAAAWSKVLPDGQAADEHWLLLWLVHCAWVPYTWAAVVGSQAKMRAQMAGAPLLQKSWMLPLSSLPLHPAAAMASASAAARAALLIRNSSKARAAVY
ncbi:MAG: hypothetical protein ACXWK9_00720, partial [Myxococcaceae bacterium]